MKPFNLANLIAIVLIVLVAYIVGVSFAVMFPGEMDLTSLLDTNTTDEKLLIIGDKNFYPVYINKPYIVKNTTNYTNYTNQTNKTRFNRTYSRYNNTNGHD